MAQLFFLGGSVSAIKSRLLKQARRGVLVLPIDGFFFGFVSPTNANSFVVVGGCLLLALTFYSILAFVVELLTVFIPLTPYARRRLVMSATFLLTFSLVMQSIGQLGLRDVLVVFALVAALYLYWVYLAHDSSKDYVTY